jgi:hypothetical protein
MSDSPLQGGGAELVVLLMVKRGASRPDLLWRDQMTKRSRKDHKAQVKLQGYVVVTFAEDLDQAREFESLLKVNDVPVIVEEQKDQLGNSEIAVMVPEEFLDEAHVIIESQDAYDDFYDFAVDDEDDEEFGADAFDDDF